MRYILSGILTLCIYSFTVAQLTVNMDLSKDSLHIGEELELSIRITGASGRGVTAIDYSAFDSIKSEVKTSNIPDSMLRETFAEIEWPQDADFPNRKFDISQFVLNGSDLEKKILIRIWDIGVFQMPQLKIFSDSLELQTRYLQSPVVFVLPPTNPEGEILSPQDTTQALMPIETIITEAKTWEDFVWIAYLLAALLTLLLVIYMVFYRKRKSEVEEIEIIEIKRPAHEISLEKLDQLKDKQLWQAGKIKAYQSELTYIIREYLENRFEINALESTTEEITRALKEKDFDQNQENNLREILQIADLVKFAKANPPADIHDRFFNQAVGFVEATKLLIQKLMDDDVAE